MEGQQSTFLLFDIAKENWRNVIHVKKGLFQRQTANVSSIRYSFLRFIIIQHVCTFNCSFIKNMNYEYVKSIFIAYEKVWRNFNVHPLQSSWNMLDISLFGKKYYYFCYKWDNYPRLSDSRENASYSINIWRVRSSK